MLVGPFCADRPTEYCRVGYAQFREQRRKRAGIFLSDGDRDKGE
jgi:hypothetical protein